MSNAPSSGSGLTALGKVFSIFLVLGLIGLGGWIAFRKIMMPQQGGARGGASTQAAGSDGSSTVPADGALVETKTSVPKLAAATAYLPKDNTIDVELSQYAGYAGLIVANGGLEPSENSYFAKKHGFKVRITLSEEESWDELNSGKMAASATTVDVLAVYGRQFRVVTPAQIGYSRGADGLVVRNDIRKVNDLKGKVIVSSQFTEADFFIRYLAKEAGLAIHMLQDLNAAPDPDAINAVYCDDGEAAAGVFVSHLNAGSQKLAGCVTWAPFTTEIPEQSKGKAKLLVSNKNLLIVGDILIVNQGFAEKNPKMVEGLVDGLLWGNNAVRNDPAANADLIGKALKWERAETLEELKKVHLSNLPEQKGFFSGGINQGGSFASIYQSAVLAYGSELIPNAADSDPFVYKGALEAAEKSGAYASQAAAILPIAAGNAATELDPVLSKDIRFMFEVMSSTLDMKNRENLANLDAIKRIVDVSPGSRIVLVGHVDNTRIPEFQRTGGQALVDKMALEAMQLSKERANEIKKRLVEYEKIDAARLETVPRGWTQPVSTNGDLNRRVEVQWFTLE
jgi:NitT/TauT family transport system substrate-binding protein